MHRVGQVAIEILTQRAGRQFVRDQVVQQQHVRLLDQLRGGNALTAEQHVRGQRRVTHLGRRERLQVPVAGELLVAASPGVVAVDEAGGQLAPPGDLGGVGIGVVAVAVAVAVVDGLSDVATGGEVPPGGAQSGGATKVPADHDVGVGVVVDVLVVLVGADHPTQVNGAVGVLLESGRPVPRGLDQQGPRGTVGHPPVPAPQVVVPRRPGDVGDDVLLEPAGLDRELRAVERHGGGGRGLAAIDRRLPRQAAAGAALRSCPLPCRRQTAPAVLEHRP